MTFLTGSGVYIEKVMFGIPEKKIKLLVQKYLTDTLTSREKRKLGNLSLKYPRVMEVLDQMESEGIASPDFQIREEAALQKGLEKVRAILYPNS